jgi:D-beta-D-heptose 7-phosphate kinase/D-beta-D-heptose 1-phosphate adenosyltransferase
MNGEMLMLDFSDLKVLVLGDVALDIVTEGPSYRQSPEAPVPVISNPTTTYSLGMAANVALNLHRLGANLAFSFNIGEDEKGELFGKLLDSNFSGVHHTRTGKKDYFTTVKQRIVANNQQVARIDFEDSLTVDKLDGFIKSIERRVNRGAYYDLIIISDYNKGIITKESWEILEPLLWQLSKRFFVDTKKKDVLNYYEGMYIFPNKKEMQEIMDYNNCNTRNELRKEMDLDFLVETASEEGAYLYKDDGKIYHCEPFKANVVDVTGCGDTFVAAFALYYTKYMDKKAALGFANYCCSKVIERKGTTPVLLSEVLDFEAQSI